MSGIFSHSVESANFAPLPPDIASRYADRIAEQAKAQDLLVIAGAGAADTDDFRRLAMLQSTLLEPGGARTVGMLDGETIGWHLDVLLCADTLAMPHDGVLRLPTTVSPAAEACLRRRTNGRPWPHAPLNASTAHALGLVDIVFDGSWADDLFHTAIRRIARRANGENAVVLARKRIHPQAMEAADAAR